jgi:hypothetical protein
MQLPNSGMAQHGPKEIFHVVGSQPRLRCLFAPGRDEVFFPSRMKGGKSVELLDVGDLFDHALALGQQFDQLRINAVDLLA